MTTGHVDMVSGVFAMAVGIVLCFFGVRSLHLAVVASGLALGWLLAEPFDAGQGAALIIAVAVAALAWVLVVVVFRTGLFFIGALTGAIIGAKLLGLFQGTDIVLAILFAASTGFLTGLAVQRYRLPMVALACALGGAGLALSGLAWTFPDALGFLREPAAGWQAVVAGTAWIALGAVGWSAQRAHTAQN
ncbi:hypothetical protein JOD54_004482 [Actinokineospora baliensis]|uniref:DUF4203 domain-containing protein n=1 Tax=Actinokineospora baliensis TaxID=547056 RepID=UPI001956F1DA|nr:DUF4203 domain-containing protein [Actinokineospora baliensis]MBM7774278.1 hypothetical protein [Actinokineospora baliensis]